MQVTRLERRARGSHHRNPEINSCELSPESATRVPRRPRWAHHCDRLIMVTAGLRLVAALVVLARRQSSVEATAPGVPTPPPPIPDNPGEQIPGPVHPEDPSNVAAWWAALTAWRARVLAKINYNGSIYDVSRLLGCCCHHHRCRLPLPAVQ